MKSLSSILKLQFFIGFIGTLVLMPVLYVVEVFWGGYSHSESFVWLDIIMIFLAPILAGVAFFLTGFAAFPVLKLMQRRGIIKDLL